MDVWQSTYRDVPMHPDLYTRTGDTRSWNGLPEVSARWGHMIEEWVLEEACQIYTVYTLSGLMGALLNGPLTMGIREWVTRWKGHDTHYNNPFPRTPAISERALRTASLRVLRDLRIFYLLLAVHTVYTVYTRRKSVRSDIPRTREIHTQNPFHATVPAASGFLLIYCAPRAIYPGREFCW